MTQGDKGGGDKGTSAHRHPVAPGDPQPLVAPAGLWGGGDWSPSEPLPHSALPIPVPTAPSVPSASQHPPPPSSLTPSSAPPHSQRLPALPNSRWCLPLPPPPGTPSTPSPPSSLQQHSVPPPHLPVHPTHPQFTPSPVPQSPHCSPVTPSTPQYLRVPPLRLPVHPNGPQSLPVAPHRQHNGSQQPPVAPSPPQWLPVPPSSPQRLPVPPPQIPPVPPSYPQFPSQPRGARRERAPTAPLPARGGSTNQRAERVEKPAPSPAGGKEAPSGKLQLCCPAFPLANGRWRWRGMASRRANQRQKVGVKGDRGL